MMILVCEGNTLHYWQVLWTRGNTEVAALGCTLGWLFCKIRNVPGNNRWQSLYLVKLHARGQQILRKPSSINICKNTFFNEYNWKIICIFSQEICRRDQNVEAFVVWKRFSIVCKVSSLWRTNNVFKRKQIKFTHNT